MKNRCKRSKTWNYNRYGGAGITYDPRWDVFAEFFADMGQRPEGTTLDRIDSTQNYCKNNCRWATPAQQQANRKNCLILTHNGVTKTAAEWSVDLGLSKGAVWNRVMLQNWPVDKAVTLPKGSRL